MCGRFNIIDSPTVRLLLDIVGARLAPTHFSHDFAPGARIPTITEHDGAREAVTATWWLLLDHKTLKPNYKYPSFNSRSDRLDDPRGIAYQPFRESRCIIPASAFVEGLGDGRTYYRIEQEGRAIAFGGLCRDHLHPDTGETVRSASIITLPPPPQWANIHPKSMPLILDQDDGELLDKWLDPGFREVSAFAGALRPLIRHPQRITPIDRPSKWNPIGESFLVNSAGFK